MRSMFPAAMSVLLFAALHAGVVVAQSPPVLPSSFPHAYPGIPNTRGDFSNAQGWQNYFEVTDALPNVSFPLSRSFAGNLPVNRPNHPNNTLFFWAYEKTNGSLTQSGGDQPWIIWLNGGPGSSSLLGLLLENGPIHFNADFTAFKNNFSWDTAADVVWVDQPVGVGWSTSDADAFVANEDEMGVDFMGFLSNLVQVFPALKTRPLYLTGESYAGFYIPYITKTYFSMANPPVRMAKIAMADGSYAQDMTDIFPAVPIVLETYPQLIGYDPAVLTYFREQNHLCGYDVNLTYPQNGIIPTINPPATTIAGQPSTPPPNGSSLSHSLSHSYMTTGRRSRLLGGVAGNGVSFGGERGVRERALRRTLTHVEKARAVEKRGLGGAVRAREVEARRAMLKRDLTGRPNGTLDPFYGCDTYDEMIDYALNFSAPWAGNDQNGFDVYFIPDALDPEAPPTPNSVGVFLNDPRVVTAIHAPTSKNWTSTFTLQQGYPFGGGFQGDPSDVPMDFFSEMASNLSAHGMRWVLMSGNADSLLPHFGSEIVIQNTTFGGIQGFTQHPSTPFFDSQGNFAGKVHQERNLTFALFVGAGHLIPQTRPVASLTFLNEFILGSNPLGTLLSNGTTVGGTNSTLAQNVMPAAPDPIFFGTAKTAGSIVAPSATIAAWENFVATADLSGVPGATPSASATAVGGGGQHSSSGRRGWRADMVDVALGVGVGVGGVAVWW